MVPNRQNESDTGCNTLGRYRLSSHWCSQARLTVIIILCLGVGLVLAYGVSRQRVFMPGDVSVKHNLFAEHCINCHTPWKILWGKTPDQPCMSCHHASPHFGNRSVVNAPQCASCHTEHQGRTLRVDVPEAKCIQCHGNLRVKNGPATVDTEIRGFHAGHPEFAVSIPDESGGEPRRVRLSDTMSLRDAAVLYLNHKVHLDPNLMGPNGIEPLRCASCHRLDEQGAYMRPVTYENACSRCHHLDFDERLPGTMVSHGIQPEEINQYLRATYAEYDLFTHHEELRGRKTVKRTPGTPRTKEELWVDAMVMKAEQHVLGRVVSKGRQGKCLLCHAMAYPEAGGEQGAGLDQAAPRSFPTVVKTGVPPRWFPYSHFDHMAHRSIVKDKGCVACHAAAERSETTDEVLLPRMESCQACHFDPGGARMQCITCHRYHAHEVLSEHGRAIVIPESRKRPM